MLHRFRRGYPDTLAARPFAASSASNSLYKRVRFVDEVDIAVPLVDAGSSVMNEWN